MKTCIKSFLMFDLRFIISFTSADTAMVKFVFAAWHVNVLPKSSLVRLLYTILFNITPVRVTSSDESKSDPDCHHVTFGNGSPLN